MKLKKLAEIVLVGCAVVTFSACSSMKKNTNDDAAITDADASQTQTAGVGDNDSFGNDGAQGNLSKRTYYFEFDRSDIRESDKPSITANANDLAAHSTKKVIVEGHTDPRGSREYNIALGERRANSVADMLKSNGADPGQVKVVSYGAQRLGSPDHSEAGYQLDRRAVIVPQN